MDNGSQSVPLYVGIGFHILIVFFLNWKPPIIA